MLALIIPELAKGLLNLTLHIMLFLLRFNIFQFLETNFARFYKVLFTRLL